jgi:ribosome biogenesis GTPase
MVGDSVTLTELDTINSIAQIESVDPRINQLERPQVANINQLLVVAACTQPQLDCQQLDRYLSVGQLKNLPTKICLTKKDLLTETELKTLTQEIIVPYQALGFKVDVISIYNPDSLNELKNNLKNKRVVLAGQSGVGKSSLLNALEPELDIKTQEVSDKLGRGTHTTRHVSLIKLDENTFVADTPGFSNLRLDFVTPLELQKAFIEFAQFECEFPDCKHESKMSDADLETSTELKALQKGCWLETHPKAITSSRYQSYLQQLEEATEYETVLKKTSQKERYGVKKMDTGKENQQDRVKLKAHARSDSRRKVLQDLSRVTQLKDLENIEEDSITID